MIDKTILFCIILQVSQPRTGKALILATKPFASDFTATSWWHVFSTACLFAAAIAGTLSPVTIAGRVVCSILAGLLFLRLFVLYHDQQHHAILPHSTLAEIIMRIFGILSLSPVSIWRSSHNYHHNHNSKLRTSHIGSFPIMTKTRYLNSPWHVRLKYLYMRHPLTILFGYLVVFLYGMCFAPTFRNPRKHFDCLFAFCWHIALAATLFATAGWPALVLTLVIPHFISSAVGTYLFYAQHNFPGVSFNDRHGWTYDRAALESSSFMKTGPIMGWFTANIGYHHIHHLNSRIPFYRLPEAVAAIPELQSPRTTSLHFLEIARCLRLKVWDAEAKRMIGLSEL
jgi:omega-6 fatty acid desaturase (delta-12 desaturase)